MQVITFASLLALLLWSLLCALGDARERRIPNSLVLKGAAGVALFLLVYRENLTGGPLADSALGFCTALLVTLPGYWLGRMGAGDVKMLAVIGLATSVEFVAYTVGTAALWIVLWFLAAPALWPRLPERCKTAFPALAPPLAKLPYAPFLCLGMIVASLMALLS
jgi:prepilin peptidase CpaA